MCVTAMQRPWVHRIQTVGKHTGQTDQEYLASHYRKTGLFFTANQNGLDLLAELNKIQNFTQPCMDHIPVNDTKAFRQLLSS